MLPDHDAGMQAMTAVKSSIWQLLEPLPVEDRWFPLVELLHNLTGIGFWQLQKSVERSGYPIDKKADPEVPGEGGLAVRTLEGTLAGGAAGHVIGDPRS
jgi:hypothetical protein